MKNIFIHVGMPKTGTTYLQDEIFPNLNKNEVFYWGKKNKSCPIAMHHLLFLNPIITSLSKLKGTIDKYLLKIKQNIILISDEVLFGGCIGGTHLNYISNYYLTQYLNILFPDAKIIFTIRRQDDFLESLYLQTLKEGYFQSINKFLNIKNNRVNNYIPFNVGGINIGVKCLNYLKYYNNYIKVFGEKNVFILPYELLRKDRKIFLDKLYAFMDITPFYPGKIKINNPSFSFVSGKLALLLNSFFIFHNRSGYGFFPQKPFNNFLKERCNRNIFYKISYKISGILSLRFIFNQINKISQKKRNFINTEKRRVIMKIHSHSNSILSKKANLRLKEYGYY